MKRIVAVLLLSIVVLLTGCGMHEFKQGDPLLALELSKESAKAACYQAQARNVVNTTGMTAMERVLVLQQQSYERLVGALTGKSFDPCGGGTNLNDVIIADSNNRNRSVQVLGGGILNATKWVAGAWAATEIVDSIGKNAGSTSNVDTGGGDSTVSNSRTNSETNTDVTNTGEEGTATTSGSFDATDPATDPVVPGIDIVDTPVVVTDN